MMIEKVRTAELLDDIPFEPDIAKIMVRMELHGGEQLGEPLVRQLADAAKKIARPKVLYRESLITRKTENSVEIDGVEFVSHLLRVNLDRAGRVFPYAATCGNEIESWQIPGHDGRQLYCLRLIKEMMLTNAVNHLQRYLGQRYGLDILFLLNPGEMQAWPSDQRKLLFSLLGDVEGSIGVKLAGDNSLAPEHSRTGIFYATDVEFESCQVCSREPCMGRRAPYNEELAKKHPRQATRICGQ